MFNRDLYRRAVLPLLTCAAISPASSAGIDVRTVQQPRAAVARALDLQNFAATPIGGTVSLEGLPVGDQRLDLTLERFSVWTDDAVFYINDRPSEKPGVVLLRGTVDGDPDSRVVLGVGTHATNGLIQTAGKVYSVSTGKRGALKATPDDIRIADLAGFNFDTAAHSCGINDDNIEKYAPFGVPIQPGPGHQQANRGTAPCRVARIAIDSDWEWTQERFGGDADAAAEYALFLVAAISEIYQRDVNVRLVVPYLRTFSSNVDPYNGTTSPDPLDQVRDYWNANMGDVQRETVHLLTGVNTAYGGIAYLPALCNESYGYGVSAYMDGSFPYPLQMNSYSNWDLIVMAHELGHNFGAPHTHDYNPPIDNCGIDCSGSHEGTIMSYCHICSGGLINIDLRFHPLVQQSILDYLEFNAPCNLQLPNAAADDAAATDAGVPVDIYVLANDSGSNCAPVGIQSVQSPTPGGATVTIEGWDNPTGDPTGHFLRFTSNANFNGIDSFTYTTTTGQTATVTVDVNGPDNCGIADLADPFGVLDLADITAFVIGFQLQLDEVDFAEPFGVWDLSDISAFLAAFNAGCE